MRKKQMKRKVDKIIDGDTFRVKRKVNGSNYIRLANVDAPELNTRAGKVAKARLRKVLGKNVNLITRGRSYSRVVADVRNGRRSVNRQMRKYGY